MSRMTYAGVLCIPNSRPMTPLTTKMLPKCGMLIRTHFRIPWGYRNHVRMETDVDAQTDASVVRSSDVQYMLSTGEKGSHML